MARAWSDISDRFSLLRNWWLDLAAVAAITAIIGAALFASFFFSGSSFVRWGQIGPGHLPKDSSVGGVSGGAAGGPGTKAARDCTQPARRGIRLMASADDGGTAAASFAGSLGGATPPGSGIGTPSLPSDPSLEPPAPPQLPEVPPLEPPATPPLPDLPAPPPLPPVPPSLDLPPPPPPPDLPAPPPLPPVAPPPLPPVPPPPQAPAPPPLPPIPPPPSVPAPPPVPPLPSPPPIRP